MSHISIIDVEIQDLEAIKAICASLGLEFREHQKTYRWYGHHVGDYPIPEGFTQKDLGRCDHALAVKGKPDAYEVGLVKRGDRYHVFWDFWSGGFGLEKCVGQNGQKLIDSYTNEVAIKEAKAYAKAYGWTYTQSTLPETEEIVLTLRQY